MVHRMRVGDTSNPFVIAGKAGKKISTASGPNMTKGTSNSIKRKLFKGSIDSK